MPLALTQLIQFDQSRIDADELVAGIDEAGRGPLAGPVVAACVIVKRSNFTARIDDSKKLSAKQREQAFSEILTHCEMSVAFIEHERIDAINILRATFEAMQQAYLGLATRVARVLIDGPHAVDLPVPVEAVPKGDSKSLAIACASIAAKVTRDRVMDLHHDRYPQYGFDQHKGYGTSQHLAALKEFGPCPIHRRSFAPVADCLSEGMSHVVAS